MRQIDVVDDANRPAIEGDGGDPGSTAERRRGGQSEREARKSARAKKKEIGRFRGFLKMVYGTQ